MPNSNENTPRPSSIYCKKCGTHCCHEIPEGDLSIRAICPSCGYIDYDNPKIVVGTLPFWSNKILLCRRAIEPRYGYWTLPAGFMECEENTSNGALRETIEEANANANVRLPVFTIIDIPQIAQVHLFFLAPMVDLTFSAGTESLDVKLFSISEIPWNELAFESVAFTLRQWVKLTQTQSGASWENIQYQTLHHQISIDL